MNSRLQLDMRNLSLGRRHLVNAYEVEAGIGVITDNTMWSMPERLECEVLQKVRYINTLTFTFSYLHLATESDTVKIQDVDLTLTSVCEGNGQSLWCCGHSKTTTNLVFQSGIQECVNVSTNIQVYVCVCCNHYLRHMTEIVLLSAECV